MRRILLPLAAVALLGILASILRPTRASVSAPKTRTVASATVRASAVQPTEPEPPALPPPAPKPKPRVWPTSAVPLGAPSSHSGLVPPAPRTPPVSPEAPPAKEGPAPQPRLTIEEMRKVAALDKEEPESAPRIQALLADPDRPTALKLLALQKLRNLDPQSAVPVLVGFMESDQDTGPAFLKTTAAGVLADISNPLAKEALTRLGSSCPDPGVRLTIAALQAKENSR